MRRRPGHERGQATVEFALLALAFFLTFFLVIQLALIAVAKHELNHLAFQTARLWSLQKSDKIDDALQQARAAYKQARGDSRMAAYLADNLRASVESGRVKFTGKIPLLIPGAAHVIQNFANSPGSPTGRAVTATLLVPMRREPEAGLSPRKHPEILVRCIVEASGKKKPKEPLCYDNDGL